MKAKHYLDDDYIEYESRGDKDNNLSPEEYLNKIRPYLRKMIDNHKAHSEWKIQLIMRINFVSPLDSKRFHKTHTKRDNIEIMNGIETNDIINEFFNSFFRRCQEGLETKMKGSDFVFNRVDLLYYKLHKISLNRGGSYIDSTDWIKNKKATINPKNEDKECFKYATVAPLNYNRINNHLEKYLNLNRLLIIIIGKIYNFQRIQIIGKDLNKIIRQLLLIYYMYHTILCK